MSIPLLSAALACLVLGACATETAPAPQAMNCGSREPATGTMIVRRERCVETTEAERDAARRQAERMIEEQQRMNRSMRSGPGGS